MYECICTCVCVCSVCTVEGGCRYSVSVSNSMKLVELFPSIYVNCELVSIDLLFVCVCVCACVCVCVRMYRGVFGDTHTLHLRKVGNSKTVGISPDPEIAG